MKNFEDLLSVCEISCQVGGIPFFAGLLLPLLLVTLGYYPSEVHQRYLHYLTSPRKTQFGKLDPEKRAKSAPPPPTLPAQHGQTTPTRVTSGRTTSRMSKR